MNRQCRDARIWGPLVVAGAALLLRGAPGPAARATTTPHAVELPALHAGAEPRGSVDYVLDAERSSVRFLVGGQLTTCPAITGHLHVRDDGSRELELDLDLGSLQPHGDQPAPTPLDPGGLLGVPRASHVLYRANLLRTTSSNLPGVTGQQWLGTLDLGERAVQQPFALWQVSLPGQPLRLQGHGPVAGGIQEPARNWFGIPSPSHVLLLGFDLAWRRHRGN